MTEANLYEVLGLTEEATKDEIKRAYYRGIRIHTNEKHPEKFQQLTKAYQTLYDDQKRAEYDRNHQDGGRYATMINNAVQQINTENYYVALTTLEEMSKEYPNEPEVRYLLGRCYLELSRIQEAKNIVTQLVFDDPSSEDYRFLLSQVYIQLKDFHNAKIQLRKLIDIDPLNRNYYMHLSSIYVTEERYVESTAVLEEGLAATSVDLADYPLLADLYFIAYFKDDAPLQQSALKRMEFLQNSEDNQQLLHLLIGEFDKTNSQHPGLPDLIRLINKMNAGRYPEVNEWLKDKQYFLNDHSPFEQTYHETSATVVEDNYQEGGSLFTSIIIGVVLSFIATPIVGVIGGIAYYNYGDKVLKVAGWLVVIVIAIIFLAIFF